jgi:hypothetical protein
MAAMTSVILMILAAEPTFPVCSMIIPANKSNDMSAKSVNSKIG